MAFRLPKFSPLVIEGTEGSRQTLDGGDLFDLVQTPEDET